MAINYYELLGVGRDADENDLKRAYRQLAMQADRLAHVLASQGAGIGRIVAFSLPRSVDLAVAVLAVLKAGAAYLPLDPAYPAERLAFMLGDSAAAVLLTTETLRTGCKSCTVWG